MELKGILAISGKPGLFKMLSQGKNNIIVEGLDDNKRFPVYAAHQISALEEISIYTETEDVPLVDVFKGIFDATGGKEAISHKSSKNQLEELFEKALPEYDRERVYISDIKKVIQWYNILFRNGLMVFDEKTEEEKTEDNGQEDNKQTSEE
jgi:L-lactate utilization protein LutC